MTNGGVHFFIAGALIAVSAILPFPVVASTVISNTVTTEASSGGSSAGAGEVVEGKSSSQVKVRTIVDDEVVEDYEKTSEGTGETRVEYHKTLEVDTPAHVSTDLSVEASAGGGDSASSTVSTTTMASSSTATVGDVQFPSQGDVRAIESVRVFINKVFTYLFSIF